jgi:outer membrane protein assembly factor BamB
MNQRGTVMNTARSMGAIVACVLLGASVVCADDWPQWRGPNRDNKVTGVTIPKAWPKALTEKWKVEVGLGDGGPVLVGDHVYVFTRQGGNEVIACLNAGTGKEVWRDKYAAEPATGAARGHAGPRSTPAVGDGVVVTLGVRGMLSCLNAATGKEVWRKDTKGWPRFFTSSSPIIVDGKVIADLGSDDGGEVVAYDLKSGAAKWKWAGPGPAYGSPVLATIGGTKQLVVPTRSSVVGIAVADGKLLWQFPFQARYNTSTPIIDGETVIYSGPQAGSVALKIEKKEGKFAATKLWEKNQAPSQYNTPVLRDGYLYGIVGGGGRRGKGKGKGKGAGTGSFFCMSAKTGEEAWKAKTPCGDCGSVLDAGPVLLAVTNDSHLVVFKPNNKEYEEVAKYKVADTPVWSPPIIAGNRVFVKDRDMLRLWMIE